MNIDLLFFLVKSNVFDLNKICPIDTNCQHNRKSTLETCMQVPCVCQYMHMKLLDSSFHGVNFLPDTHTNTSRKRENMEGGGWGAYMPHLCRNWEREDMWLCIFTGKLFSSCHKLGCLEKKLEVPNAFNDLFLYLLKGGESCCRVPFVSLLCYYDTLYLYYEIAHCSSDFHSIKRCREPFVSQYNPVSWVSPFAAWAMFLPLVLSHIVNWSIYCDL